MREIPKKLKPISYCNFTLKFGKNRDIYIKVTSYNNIMRKDNQFRMPAKLY